MRLKVQLFNTEIIGRSSSKSKLIMKKPISTLVLRCGQFCSRSSRACFLSKDYIKGVVG